MPQPVQHGAEVERISVYQVGPTLVLIITSVDSLRKTSKVQQTNVLTSQENKDMPMPFKV